MPGVGGRRCPWSAESGGCGSTRNGPVAERGGPFRGPDVQRPDLAVGSMDGGRLEVRDDAPRDGFDEIAGVATSRTGQRLFITESTYGHKVRAAVFEVERHRRHAQDTICRDDRRKTSVVKGFEVHHMRVNGEDVDVNAPGTKSLAVVLREQMRLTGTKVACGRGECGACTVLVDGRPTMSCIQPAALVDGDVETIEGVADESADLREQFADRGAFQCGFCTPGQLVHATALLRALASGEPPAVADIRHALSGNICRCTGYQAIAAAVLDVAEQRKQAIA